MTFAENPPSLREIDDPKLAAIVETMFLAAFADGDFGEEERVEFLKSVESLTDRRVSGEMLGALMTSIIDGLRRSGRPARLVSVRDRLPDAGARKIALSLAIRVVAA